MDIYSLIRRDHQRVRELFAKLEDDSGNGAERAPLFALLKGELTAHRTAEEATFYAALSTLPEISDRIEAALEEHVDIDELLQELSEVDVEDEAFATQLAELREEVEHHVDEEEGEVFDEARELLTDEQAERIAQEMEAEKARLAQAQ